MDPQLKIIFGLQAFGAFILMMVVIYFAFDLGLLLSAAISAGTTFIISFWGIAKYKKHQNKQASNK